MMTSVDLTQQWWPLLFRTATARGKAEQADYAAVCAREDSSEARSCARQFDPQFLQPGESWPERFMRQSRTNIFYISFSPEIFFKWIISSSETLFAHIVSWGRASSQYCMKVNEGVDSKCWSPLKASFLQCFFYLLSWFYYIYPRIFLVAV